VYHRLHHTAYNLWSLWIFSTSQIISQHFPPPPLISFSPRDANKLSEQGGGGGRLATERRNGIVVSLDSYKGERGGRLKINVRMFVSTRDFCC
jgi:hypothetical protein